MAAQLGRIGGVSSNLTMAGSVTPLMDLPFTLALTIGTTFPVSECARQLDLGAAVSFEIGHWRRRSQQPTLALRQPVLHSASPIILDRAHHVRDRRLVRTNNREPTTPVPDALPQAQEDGP